MVIRLLPYLRTIIEVVGLGCLVAGAFLWATWAGLTALGLALILAANFAGRTPNRL